MVNTLNKTINIYTEQQFGLYENPQVANLDPLNDLLRYNPFHDSFWDDSEWSDEDSLQDLLYV